MKKTHPIKLVAASLVALTVLTGCGGGSGGGRPTVDEISTSLQEADNPLGVELDEKTAGCIAEAFHKSDISDEGLQAIVDQDEDYEASKADEDAISSISTSGMTECMTAG